MDLNALKLFVEIVDAGNLSAAARRLHTTRSNVSHRLKAFEQEVGVQLLRRSTRRIEPTQVGYALYQHGASILREMAAAKAAVATLGKSLHGHVRISVPTGLGQLYLGGLLLDFAKKYPDITLAVVFSNRVGDLMASEVDIALRIMAEPPEQYVARELGEVDWVLCAAPEYLAKRSTPTTPEELARLDLISTPVLRGSRLPIRLRRQGRQVEIQVTPHIESENFIFLKNAVCSGIGFAILPYYEVHRELAAGALLRLLPDFEVDVWGNRLYMITAPNLFPTLATRSLMEFLTEHVRAMPLPRMEACQA